MNKKQHRPEAWHATTLRDYCTELTAAVRSLEFQLGYSDGVAEAQVAA